MRKILFSLMTFVLVVGLVGGGAFAYFSDVETSTGNVFSAGTIDIEVSDDGGLNFENPWERLEFVIAPTAKPCEKYWDVIVVHNAGDNPLLVWKHIGELVCTGGENPEPEQEQEAQTGVNDNLAEVVWYDLVIAMTAAGEPGTTVADFDTWTGIPGAADPGDNDEVIIPQGYVTLEEMECYWFGPFPLGPSEVLVIAQSYHIDAEAGNEYQGDTCTFTVEFYAEQLGGPGPPPGP